MTLTTMMQELHDVKKILKSCQEDDDKHLAFIRASVIDQSSREDAGTEVYEGLPCYLQDVEDPIVGELMELIKKYKRNIWQYANALMDSKFKCADCAATLN